MKQEEAERKIAEADARSTELYRELMEIIPNLPQERKAEIAVILEDKVQETRESVTKLRKEMAR